MNTRRWAAIEEGSSARKISANEEMTMNIDGYRVFGELQDFPQGCQRYFMTKQL